MRVEILDLPPLSEREITMCEMHSFYNVMNVVMVELQLLQKIAGNEQAFLKSLLLCQDILESFHSRALALKNVRAFETIIQTIEADIANAEASGVPQEGHREFWVRSVENLRNIFSILETRVKEILARAQAMSPWEEMPLAKLEKNMKDVLAAIEKNAHGRYRIVCAPEAPDADSYSVCLELSSANGTSVQMPPVLQDVMRDLMANARKYSRPGSTISVSLREEDDSLVYEVSDEGRGIPEDEIMSVVHFGQRGSNTMPEEMKGGGFGLTKAFLVCQQYNGQMWIDSAPECGCRITLRLPKPAA